VLNRYAALFRERGLPVFATRDWHPPDHCSFAPQGGPWPPHCIAGTEDAAFAPELELPDAAQVISKATEAGREAYSGFDGTDLAECLHGKGVKRVFVGGLATDYCVLNTVLDGLKAGFEVYLLRDAVRGVNVHPGDDVRAIDKMQQAGAVAIGLEVLE
jgi:nicotinamidase/pyrazinamidase